MPDNLLPPSGGPPPFDERDLDAVLAGETTDVSAALRPVADALASLRAAPSPSELRGEANAMAQFRELGQGQAEPAPTLLLPAQADGRRRPTARHRGPRRVSTSSRRRNGALLATGAAAAIVAAAVFTGSLPDPIAHLARTPSNSPSAAHDTRNSSSPKVETSTAAKDPTGSPSATGSAASGQSIAGVCSTYYGYYKHPQSSDAAAEASLEDQLSRLAGTSDRHKMYLYCAPYIAGIYKHWIPALDKAPPPAHSGSGGSGSNSQGSQVGGAGSNQNGGFGAQQNG